MANHSKAPSLGFHRDEDLHRASHYSNTFCHRRANNQCFDFEWTPRHPSVFVSYTFSHSPCLFVWLCFNLCAFLQPLCGWSNFLYSWVESVHFACFCDWLSVSKTGCRCMTTAAFHHSSLPLFLRLKSTLKYAWLWVCVTAVKSVGSN